MVALSLKADVKQASKYLDHLSKKQIPFATALALTKTAMLVRDKEQATMQTDLASPTPTTIKGVRFKGANKKTLESRVFILPAIAAFLNWQVEGGTRPPKGKAEAVPVGINLNKYGNIPGRKMGKISKIIAKPDTFVGKIKGISGVWQQKGVVLKLLLSFEKQTKYKIRWKFYEIANKEALKRFVVEFNKAIAFALK